MEACGRHTSLFRVHLELIAQPLDEGRLVRLHVHGAPVDVVEAGLRPTPPTLQGGGAMDAGRQADKRTLSAVPQWSDTADLRNRLATGTNGVRGRAHANARSAEANGAGWGWTARQSPLPPCVRPENAALEEVTEGAHGAGLLPSALGAL